MTSISTFGQSLSQIQLFTELQSKFGTLNTQLATGKITQKYSGLDTAVLTSQRARTDFKTLDAYVKNAVNAERRIQQTVTGVEEFKKQVQNFSNALIGFSQQNVHQQGEIVYYDDPLTVGDDRIEMGHTSAAPDTELSTLQDMASGIFDFVYELMNIKDGDRYLLGGAETNTPPVTNNGTLDAAISTLISNWKDEGSGNNIATGSLINALTGRNASVDADAITDTIVGYNATLSAGNAGNIYARIDDNNDVNYTALANEQGFRDILVALSFFKNPDLGPIADTYIPPNEPPNAPDIKGAPGATLAEQKSNFYNVLNNMTSMVNDAMKDIDRVRVTLESARARIKEAHQSHLQTKNLLLGVISEAEDIDINEVAVKVNYLQIQLEASYRVTATVSKISLVNFI